MSKYIRTRCGVYEVKKDCVGFYVALFEKVIANPVCKDNVVKEANTIEELCDEFVIVRNGERPTILINYDDLSLLKERVKKDHQKVYGAIWTSEGLIYVAKLNDEGVWKQLL